MQLNTTVAYSSYTLGEVLNLSGIMCIFACGASMAHYTSHTITPLTLSATQYLFKSLSVVCETFLFVYLGITSIVSFRPEFNLSWSPFLIIITISLCFFARGLHIFPFTWLANFHRTTPITFQHQILIWFVSSPSCSCDAFLCLITRKSHDYYAIEHYRPVYAVPSPSPSP